MIPPVVRERLCRCRVRVHGLVRNIDVIAFLVLDLQGNDVEVIVSVLGDRERKPGCEEALQQPLGLEVEALFCQAALGLMLKSGLNTLPTSPEGRAAISV